MNKRIVLAISMILGLQAQVLQASGSEQAESQQIVGF